MRCVAEELASEKSFAERWNGGRSCCASEQGLVLGRVRTATAEERQLCGWAPVSSDRSWQTEIEAPHNSSWLIVCHLVKGCLASESEL